MVNTLASIGRVPYPYSSYSNHPMLLVSIKGMWLTSCLSGGKPGSRSCRFRPGIGKEVELWGVLFSACQ